MISHALENESYRPARVSNHHGFEDRPLQDGTDREPVGVGNRSNAPETSRTS